MLAIGGELDLYTNAILLDRIGEVTGDGTKIALDLTGVSFVDSSGLGALVGAMRRARELDQDMVLIAPPGAPLARMLALTGLDQLLQPLADRSTLGRTA